MRCSFALSVPPECGAYWRNIMGKRLKIIFCVICAGIYPAWGEETLRFPGARVEELLDLAQKENPGLMTMRLEAAAAAERIYPAGALPDPVLRTELRDITNRGGDASPNLLPNRVGSTRYTFMQALPYWGKRDLRREVAEAELSQSQGRRDETWTELSAKIKTDFARYFLAARSIKLTREMLDLGGNLERIAQ
jgi:outer membrane protein, heavy metal efflux system